MVFFILFSKLPSRKSNQDPMSNLVKKNQMTLVLGFVVYFILGGLILTNKFPLDQWLTFIPDKKYLMGIIILDLVLYLLLHRFEHGSFPSFSIINKKKNSAIEKEFMKQSENALRQIMNPSSDNQSPINQIDQSSINQLPDSTLKTKMKQTEFIDDEISILSAPLNDDLDSDLKIPAENEPEEASLPGQNYFQINQDIIVENWDLDEFTT